MNMLVVLISVVSGTVVGILAGYLLKPLLPEKPTQKNLIAAGVALVPILGINVYVAAQGGPSETNEEAEAADQVRACMQQHGLEQAEVRIPEKRDRSIGTHVKFARCEWPPPSYAGDDGYSEITVEAVRGPDTNEAEFSVVDRIRAPCETFKVSYSFGKMGRGENQPPFPVETDSVFIVTGEPWQQSFPRDFLGFYRERNEVDVLRNLSYVIDGAECGQG